MPIRALGASSYKLRLWILQCIFFCVLGHASLNFFDSKLFFEASTICCINMLYVTCYNYDVD
jgi:hypothetical protein